MFRKNAFIVMDTETSAYNGLVLTLVGLLLTSEEMFWAKAI